MKEIFIVRHAKSDWDNNLKDFDRPLNKRGFQDAPKMAKIVNEKGYKPELIISSPANRAFTTAEYFAEEFNYPKENIQKENDIYYVGQRFTLQLLTELNDNINSVMVFGHNPDHSYVAKFLSNNPDINHLPTCAVVGIKFDTNSWKNIKKETGELFLHEYPKKYK